MPVADRTQLCSLTALQSTALISQVNEALLVSLGHMAVSMNILIRDSPRPESYFKFFFGVKMIKARPYKTLLVQDNWMI